jgi:uncharacterized SAM-binding protein YcdF (DUF218 family)
VTGLEEPAVKVPKPRSRWLLAALLPVLLILLLLAFRQQILDGLGEFLVVSDPLEHADFIYVLAGDFWGSRALLGADLGSQGWAPKVIMGGGLYSGSGFVNRYAGDLSIEFLALKGYSRGLFLSVPLQALSTIDEARAMGPIFHRLGARRILLVTSNFHSRRAEQVFREFLPEFEFRMEGSPDLTFDPHAWWKTAKQRHLLFSEYQKIVGTVLVRLRGRR